MPGFALGVRGHVPTPEEFIDWGMGSGERGNLIPPQEKGRGFPGAISNGMTVLVTASPFGIWEVSSAR